MKEILEENRYFTGQSWSLHLASTSRWLSLHAHSLAATSIAPTPPSQLPPAPQPILTYAGGLVVSVRPW